MTPPYVGVALAFPAVFTILRSRIACSDLSPIRLHLPKVTGTVSFSFLSTL